MVEPRAIAQALCQEVGWWTGRTAPTNQKATHLGITGLWVRLPSISQVDASPGFLSHTVYTSNSGLSEAPVSQPPSQLRPLVVTWAFRAPLQPPAVLDLASPLSPSAAQADFGRHELCQHRILSRRGCRVCVR